MNSSPSKILKILMIIFVLFIATGFYITNQVQKGVGNSVENGVRGVYEFSKKVDYPELDSVMTYQNDVECIDSGCAGVYIGPEFVDGSDIAHQFSNKMSAKVGDKLKELYDNEKYSKVDFSRITMSTEGMGSGSVVYELKIPFKKVEGKCDAYTSFDHVGGWNHNPALNRRKSELKDVLLDGEKLDISELKTTPEGLQEYWIQWKNKTKQFSCK